MIKYKLQDYLFYAVLFSLLIYYIAKEMGYLNTPLILKIYPYLGLVFMAGVVYQRFITTENQVAKNMRLIARNNRLIKENQIILREHSREIKFLMKKIA